MADESVRSLMVELGYDVDTTGADRFKSSFKSLEKSIGDMSRRLDKKTNFNFVEKNVKKGFAKAKVAVLAGVAALAVATKKVFTGFADIESARLALEFKTDEKQANAFLKRIEQIRKETGGVVGELEAINAITLGGELTDDTQFFVDNLEKIIKLSKVSNKEFEATSGAVARFISEGGNLGELVELQIIGARQKEAIERQGTPLGALGISSRTEQARGFLKEGEGKVDPLFQKFLNTNRATLDKIANSTEEAVSSLGESFSSDINETFNILNDSIKGFTQGIKGGGGVLKGLEEGSTTGVGKGLFRLLRTGSLSEESKTSGGGTQTNNITINGAGLNPEQIGTVVVNKLKEQNRNLQQIESRKKVSRSLNTTIQTVPKQ